WILCLAELLCSLRLPLFSILSSTRFENLDIESVENKAPEPVLNVGVRQGDRRINGELNVNPGSQLTMEINLDPVSAPIYGLLVSYMQVSDTKNLEETIVYNG
ncbi:hypothetical protein WDU94_011479, partial [Cyamophila willieti]